MKRKSGPKTKEKRRHAGKPWREDQRLRLDRQFTPPWAGMAPIWIIIPRKSATDHCSTHCARRSAGSHSRWFIPVAGALITLPTADFTAGS